MRRMVLVDDALLSLGERVVLFRERREGLGGERAQSQHKEMRKVRG